MNYYSEKFSLKFYSSIMLILIQTMIMILMIMLSVAYFSLFERKLLSIIQLRKGPNKMSTMGLMQPIGDAIKLMTKVMSPPNESSKILYILSPIMFLVWSLLIWTTLPFTWNLISFSSSMMFMIICFNLSVYGLVSMGWFSNSKYASIGSIRSISQSISYEIILSFNIMCIMMLSMSVSNYKVMEMQSLTWLIFPLLPLSIVTLLTMLAESSSSPFDLPEGESELVSGFCVEYGSMLYTMIFLSENMSKLFLCMMFTILFMNSLSLGVMKVMIMVFMFVWIRSTMPRIRIDEMMTMCWNNVMPLSIILILLLSMML